MTGKVWFISHITGRQNILLWYECDVPVHKGARVLIDLVAGAARSAQYRGGGMSRGRELDITS